MIANAAPNASRTRRIGPTRPVTLFAALIAALFASPIASAAPAPATSLAAHHARYDVTLKTAGPRAAIVAIAGEVRITWRRGCGGWRFAQSTRLAFALRDGARATTQTEFKSFENDAGTAYSFESQSRRDGVVTASFRGHAQRPSAAAAGDATYDAPRGAAIALPIGTVYPMQHLRGLLAAARRGERTYFRQLFDGPHPFEEPRATNAVITAGPFPGAVGPAAGLDPLAGAPWWRVRLATFAKTNAGATPDYEVGFEVQENGVTRRFTYDYGDITLEARLVQLGPEPAPDCPDERPDEQ